MIRESGQKAGLDFETGLKMKGLMEEAGFVNVTKYEMRFPLGGWARDEHLKEGECQTYIVSASPSIKMAAANSLLCDL